MLLYPSRRDYFPSRNFFERLELSKSRHLGPSNCPNLAYSPSNASYLKTTEIRCSARARQGWHRAGPFQGKDPRKTRICGKGDRRCAHNHESHFEGTVAIPLVHRQAIVFWVDA
jgi:hypothetical protein